MLRIPVIFLSVASIIFVCLVGCLGETSSSKVLGPEASAMGRLRERACAAIGPQVAVAVKRRVIRSRKSECQPDSTASFTRLAGELREFLNQGPAFQERPECFRQAVRQVALNNAEFSSLCEPYLRLAQADEILAATPMCTENHGESPQKTSENHPSPILFSAQRALDACADALAQVSLRPKPAARPQLTVDEALRLRREGHLAFHIAPSFLVTLIQKIGLDPRLGGHGVPATYFRHVPSFEGKHREYPLPQSGFIHLTDDPREAAERADIYNFASAEAQVVAIRFDGETARGHAVPSPAMGPRDFRTDQWIGSEDVVVVPRDRWQDFGIVGTHAARLARIKMAAAKVKSQKTPQRIHPALIKFSQDTVSGAAAITESLRQHGWLDSLGFIDVVKLADGSLVTADNTRLVAASRAGIFVRALVHDEAEELSPVMARRFTTPGDGRPRTWGEAVRYRINCGGKYFRKQFPTGSYLVGSKE